MALVVFNRNVSYYWWLAGVFFFKRKGSPVFDVFPVAIPATSGWFLGSTAAQKGVRKRRNSHLYAFAKGSDKEETQREKTHYD